MISHPKKISLYVNQKEKIFTLPKQDNKLRIYTYPNLNNSEENEVLQWDLSFQDFHNQIEFS